MCGQVKRRYLNIDIILSEKKCGQIKRRYEVSCAPISRPQLTLKPRPTSVIPLSLLRGKQRKKMLDEEMLMLMSFPYFPNLPNELS